jgi:hypothetical protein
MFQFLLEEIPSAVSEWLENNNQVDAYPYIIHQVIYYCLMAALISQFFFVALDFINKSRTFKDNVQQRSYYRGLGIFILFVAICQVMYLAVAIDAHLYAQDISILLEDKDYDYTSGGETVNVFRSWWFFNEDKFVVTFFLIFVSLPFLTYPLEKYIFGREKAVLTTVCIVLAPIIIILRIIEINAPSWFGVNSLPGEFTETGTNSFLYQIISFFWFFVVVVLFFVLLLLMHLYSELGTKAPKGSKLRTKSKLVVIGLFFWMIAIFTTQNASEQLVRMADPENVAVWGVLSYFFGYSTPVFLSVALISFRKGFNRDF